MAAQNQQHLNSDLIVTAKEYKIDCSRIGMKILKNVQHTNYSCSQSLSNIYCYPIKTNLVVKHLNIAFYNGNNL